mmetsp:Transcript_29968/g.45434  ORF Transcript_29968/g.45434 Transcript_29968/m.45434 type:complete len:367 (+) Transcript_29968:109-1209(+)
MQGISQEKMRNSVCPKEDMTVIQEVLYESPLYGICYPNGPRKQGERGKENFTFTRMERIFFLVYYVSIIVAAETAAFFILDSLDIYNDLVDEIKQVASTWSTECLPISDNTVELVMQWVILPLVTNSFYFILFKPVQKLLKREGECCNPLIYAFIGVVVGASTFFLVTLLKVQDVQKQRRYLLNVVTMIGASLLVLHVIIGYVFLKIYRCVQTKCCSCSCINREEDYDREEGQEVILAESQEKYNKSEEAPQVKEFLYANEAHDEEEAGNVYVIAGQASDVIIQELRQKVMEMENNLIKEKEKRAILKEKLKQTRDELFEANEDVKFLTAKVERLQKKKEITSRRSSEALDKHKERMEQLRRSQPN